MSKTPPSRNPGIAWYDAHAASAAERYEALTIAEVHNRLLYRLPGRASSPLITLLKPGGLLAMTLRQGPVGADRGMHEVSADELRRLAREHGAWVETAGESPDRLGRDDVSWAEVAIRLPDDRTGAVPHGRKRGGIKN